MIDDLDKDIKKIIGGILFMIIIMLQINRYIRWGLF